MLSARHVRKKVKQPCRLSESKFPALAMGARGRLSAESKRLKATGKPKAPGSRTVSCPVCSRSLFMHQLNCHLDACLLSKPVAAPAHQPADISQAASGADGAAGQPSAQASHGPAACTASPGVAAELAAQDVESEQPEPTPQVASRSRTGWGSLSRAPQLSQDHLALARLSSGQKVHLTDDELQQRSPLEVVRVALPSELASRLLAELLQDQANWEQGTWWMNNQPKLAPRTVFQYNLPGAAETWHQTSSMPRESSATAAQQAASPTLAEAASLVTDHVNRLRGRVMQELEVEDRGPEGWTPSYAFANCYARGSDSVGAHTDRLTVLGIRPIIASLSLGATRKFRIHNEAAKPPKSQGRAPTSSRASAANTAAAQDTVLSASIKLTHNMLVIMWPPCQDCWKHEIPEESRVESHAISGLIRINLTFRKLKSSWATRVPQCRCKRQATLKSKANSSAHGPIYYYSCDNTQGPSCGFYSPQSFDVTGD